MKWFLALNVSSAPSAPAALSVQRSATKPAYAAEEIDLMRRLGVHVRRAMGLSAKLVASEGAALARAGVSAVAEVTSDELAGAIGAARAMERFGAARGSDLAAMFVRLATA